MNKKKDCKRRVLRKGEQQRKDGTYHYTYLEKSIDGEKPKRKYIYAKTLEDLRAKEDLLQQNQAEGLSQDGHEMTLNDLFFNGWVVKQTPLIKPSTMVNYLGRWRDHVQYSTLGNTKVALISKSQIETFYSSCISKGLKRNTIKILHILISSTLNFAMDSKDSYGRKLIKENPAAGAMKDIKKDAEEKTPLKRREVENLLQFCDSGIYNIYSPFIRIAIGSCLRIGELTGLTWNDVDLKNRTININHQLIYKNLGSGCRFYVTSLKTEKSARIIPMNDSVHRAFIELRKNDMLLGRRCNAEIDGYSNFVFLSKNGTPLATNAVNNFLLNIEKAYNKTHKEQIPHLSAHILRHTGCTLYASNGMDVKALQDIMGHTDAKITMNVYNHAEEERTESEVIRLYECMNF